MTDDRLSVESAALLAGVSTKTIRRAIQTGKLPASQGTGKTRGYQIARADVLALYGEHGSAKRSASPVEELTAKIGELLEAARDQAAKIERLESEVRDSRAQLNQFQESYLKALPEPRKGIFSRWFGSKSKRP